MNAGNMWFDDRDIPLVQKIQYALKCFEKKYGRLPNIIELPLNEEAVDGLDIGIVRYKYILPHHMLIGVEETNERSNSVEESECFQECPENN